MSGNEVDHLGSASSSTEPLKAPAGWEPYSAKNKDAINLYNALVVEWNNWAEEDKEEDIKNWARLAKSVQTWGLYEPARRQYFWNEVNRIIKHKAYKEVCWGHCVLVAHIYDCLATPTMLSRNLTLSALQRWYPDSILFNPRYNTDGPSFDVSLHINLLPIRSKVQQGNTQGSNVHQQYNTPRQNTPQQYSSPQQSNSPQENNPQQYVPPQQSNTPQQYNTPRQNTPQQYNSPQQSNSLQENNPQHYSPPQLNNPQQYSLPQPYNTQPYSTKQYKPQQFNLQQYSSPQLNNPQQNTPQQNTPQQSNPPRRTISQHPDTEHQSENYGS
ncbi:hypothetical protein FGADI_8754 [Fusarium gaditjirri]|uniref:Uncharacterized protein n=1 Tax=Fusarium gaditjirri TaxID=282569 RepID=A0A8H4T1Q8_9HYPO|nr:hypothetical protein FGADI_8754 [Fusarium gaditjirri]